MLKFVLLTVVLLVSTVKAIDPDNGYCTQCPTAGYSALSCCELDSWGYLHCYYDSWSIDWWSCGSSNLYCCYTWTWEFWVCSIVVPIVAICLVVVCLAVCLRRMRSRRSAYVAVNTDPVDYNAVTRVYVAQPPNSPPPAGIQPVPVYSSPAYPQSYGQPYKSEPQYM